MKLVVDQLQKRFGTQEVLRGASFTFEQGKIYGLIGRNGAGKTTFFWRSTGARSPIPRPRTCIWTICASTRPTGESC